MSTSKDAPRMLMHSRMKVSAASRHVKAIEVLGRPVQALDFGEIRIECVQIGVAAARERLADVMLAARSEGTNFQISNERGGRGESVLLMAPESVRQLVYDAVHRPKRKGADILAKLPFVGTGQPALRLGIEEEDPRTLKLPAGA